MDGSVLDLIARVSRIEAVVLTACGLFLIFLDINTPSEPSRLRRRLTAMWQAIAGLPASAVPAFVMAGTMRAVDRFVVYWYEQSERNVVTAGTFTLIVFIAIPIAALINWVRGGSPALLIILLACLGLTLVVAVLSEIRRFAGLTRMLSAILFAAIFLFVPAYVFVSLTTRTLGMPIAHAALASVLLTPLVYLICHSAVLMGAGFATAPVASRLATMPRRVATLFVAAVPFAFLATFGTFLLAHLIPSENDVVVGWPILLWCNVCGALAAALTGYWANPPARRVLSLAAVLGRVGACLALGLLLAVVVAVGGNLPANGSLVPTVLPLIAPIALTGVVVLALCAKGVLAAAVRLPGGGLATERPYRVAGILLLLFAAVTGWASVAL